MRGDDGRWRCNDCGRFLADRYPYQTCSDCQDRKSAQRRTMAAIWKRLDAVSQSEAPRLQRGGTPS